MAGRDRLKSYYAQRAPVYDELYTKPERQTDLEWIARILTRELNGLRVFEIAAGTGFWTQHYAASAESVTATDINPSMLAQARPKLEPYPNVTLELADAFALPEPRRVYDAVFAAFWWSHVFLEERLSFLEGLRAWMGKPTRLLLIDNRYVPGSSTPICRTDADGNTYQERQLGRERFEILKNFPERSSFERLLPGQAIAWDSTPCYWIMSAIIEPRTSSSVG